MKTYRYNRRPVISSEVWKALAWVLGSCMALVSYLVYDYFSFTTGWSIWITLPITGILWVIFIGVGLFVGIGGHFSGAISLGWTALLVGLLSFFGGISTAQIDLCLCLCLTSLIVSVSGTVVLELPIRYFFTIEPPSNQ